MANWTPQAFLVQFLLFEFISPFFLYCPPLFSSYFNYVAGCVGTLMRNDVLGIPYVTQVDF